LHKEALICYNVIAVSGLLCFDGALNGAPAPKGSCTNAENKGKIEENR
jgi:hypothetical protein